MFQKTKAQSSPFVGTRDDTWNICHHKGAVVFVRHHTQRRDDGRKGVIGNLGTRRGDLADQRRFTGVGQPQQPHIGHQFQFQAQLAFLPLFARLGKARGLVGSTGKTGITLTSPAPLQQDDSQVVFIHICQHISCFGIRDDRSNRNLDDQILTTGAVAVLALAVMTLLGLLVRSMAQLQQGRHAGGGQEDHVPPLAAVATGRTAELNELFMAKGNTTGAAMA